MERRDERNPDGEEGFLRLVAEEPHPGQRPKRGDEGGEKERPLADPAAAATGSLFVGAEESKGNEVRGDARGEEEQERVDRDELSFGRAAYCPCGERT